MCKVVGLLEKMKEVQQEYEKERKQLNAMLSKIDGEINIFYHNLEKRSFNASEGYFIASDLQKLVRKRRVIKQEMFKWSALNASLSIRELDKKIISAQKGLNKIKNDRKDSYSNNWSINLSDVEAEFSI